MLPVAGTAGLWPSTAFIMKLKNLLLPLCFICGLTAVSQPKSEAITLLEARRRVQSRVNVPTGQRDPVDRPPANELMLVSYKSPVGQLAAYLSPDPGDKKKHPAIVWITGGDCNSIGDVWSPRPASNDQTASIYRRAGIVTMYPSLRGGNRNPGIKEGFLGEVNDVIAAADALARVPYVDPTRIYLGGHSTGGTLVMLVSECTPRFRGVFSFGPVEDVAGYGGDSGFLPFNYTDQKEVAIRSPGYWMADIKSPIWVIEGASGSSNIESLRSMKNSANNRYIHFIEVPGADHFSVLSVSNLVIAKKILADGPKSRGITLTQSEIARYYR